MKFFIKVKNIQVFIVVLFSLAILFTNFLKVNAQNDSEIYVDFEKTVKPLSPLAIGIDESAYGGQKVLANDAQEVDMIKKLGVAQVRFELKISLGDIVCAAAGCNAGIGGDTWINAIRSTGAEPIIIVPDNVNDAVAILKHFNKETDKPIKRWILGNEPDNNNIDAITYSERFNQVYDAMKEIDPAIKIAGPATASFNKAFLQTFLEISGSRVDIIDYHAYGQGGPVTRTEAALFDEAQKYKQNAADLRNMILSTASSKNRAASIEIQVGEWNMDWDKDTKYFTQFSTAWSASALGSILESGSYALPYATKNGDLGALYEATNEPMPLYHGIGMFTGEGLFRRFGTTVVFANSIFNNLDVFASNNSKNIIVVNKSPNSNDDVKLSLSGVATQKIDVWRKDNDTDPKSNPIKLQSPAITNNTFTYTFPPYSVTTFVVNETATTSTPTASPSLTATPTNAIECNLHIKGDANCDELIDLLDFESFRQEFVLNRAGDLDITTAKADFNNDKSIDLLDFESFRLGFIEMRIR